MSTQTICPACGHFACCTNLDGSCPYCMSAHSGIAKSPAPNLVQLLDLRKQTGHEYRRQYFRLQRAARRLERARRRLVELGGEIRQAREARE